MKKIFILTILIGIAFSLNAQTSKSDYEKVISDFISSYNKNNSTDIFNLYSVEMKNAMPQDKAKEFIENLNRQLGKITQSDFIRFSELDRSIALFKTHFENGIFNIQLSINADHNIDGLMIKPYTDETIPVINRTEGDYRLPFNGKWYTVWGGDTKELNYHVVVPAQKNAFDFLITDRADQTYTNEGTKNSDYYCFGKELIAPCDAVVVLAVDGVKDNTPGVMNQTFPLGNTVVLKTEQNVFIYLCHFKQYSIAVKQGQKVNKGELLGLCGNSGHSSEAHLHFHVQNIEDMKNATGVKCYFNNIIVNNQLKNNYSPIQGETVSNAK